MKASYVILQYFQAWIARPSFLHLSEHLKSLWTAGQHPKRVAAWREGDADGHEPEQPPRVGSVIDNLEDPQGRVVV